MSATIMIRNAQGSIVMQATLTASAESRQTLMGEDCVKLSWNSTQNATLPVGSFITWEGEKYSLLEPYQPQQKTESAWLYEPEFQSSVMAWAKVPFFHYTQIGDETKRNPDWSLTGLISVFGERIGIALQKETGVDWSFVYGDTSTEYKSISFQSSDILSALNEIASEFDCEWWADKANHTIHFGKIKIGDAVELEVGENIGVPTVTQNKDGYYNRFYAFGSTRNIVQQQSGASTNYLVNYRLTLPQDQYPDGYYDTEEGLTQSKAMAKVLIFDDIYPKSYLKIADGSCKGRLMFRLDEQGEKKIVGYDADNNPIYETYTIWYFKACNRTTGAPFVFNDNTYSDEHPDGMMLPDLNVSVHFESGLLNGKEFELAYHAESTTEKNSDGTDFVVDAGSFEILFTEENGVIIPSSIELAPSDGDNLVLFNIKMPDDYVSSAQQRLLIALQDEIADKYATDRNNYEFKSNAVAFEELDPNLHVGQNVTYRNGDYELSTRVISIIKRLDQPSVQTITVGNSLIKGSRQSLQEEVVSANKDINVLQSLSELTQNIIQSYMRSQEAMKEGFDRINRMWQFDPNDEESIYSPYNVWSQKDISALGNGCDSGSGEGGGTGSGVDSLAELIDVLLGGNLASGDVLQYDGSHWVNVPQSALMPDLTGYATQAWVGQQGFLPAAALDGYATEIWVNGQGFLKSVAWGDVSGKPSTFAPSAHTHPWGEVTGKPSTLSGYGIADAYTDDEVDGIVAEVADKVQGALLELDGRLQSREVLNSFAEITASHVTAETFGAQSLLAEIAGVDDLTAKALMVSGKKIYFGDTSHFIELTANGCFRFSDGLYSDGFVSALGEGSGGGGAGGGAVATLSDVDLTSLAAGDLLVYNGSHWANVAQGSIMPDLTGYATQAWVGQQGFLPAAALDGYATEIWVNGQGFLKSVAWGDVSGKPSTFAPSAHTHPWGEVTGKPSTLSGYGIADAYTDDEVDGIVAEAADKVQGALLELDGRLQSREVLNSFAEITASHVTAETFGAQYALLEGLEVSGKRIYFGDSSHYLEVDDNGYFHFSHGLYSDSFVTALGSGSGSGGGAGVGLLKSWTGAYDSEADALAAALGVELHSRVTALEGKTGLENFAFSQSGSGNAVTNVAWANNTLTVTKGATFLTEHQSLAAYATQEWVNGKGYLTAHQAIYGLTLQSGAFSAKTYNPASEAANVNIPTTTDHISEGSNLYYTDARVAAKVTKAYVDGLGVAAATATKLATSRTLWGQEFDGSANVSGNMTGVGNITLSGKIYFGDADHYLEIDSTGFHFSHGVYSDSFITALGAGSGSGGSGSGYGLMKNWGQSYDEENDALAARLGVELRSLVTSHSGEIASLISRATGLEQQRDYICGALYDLDGRIQSREVLNSIGELTASHMTTDTLGAQYALIENLEVKGSVSASGGFVGELTGNVSGNAATATYATNAADSAKLGGVALDGLLTGVSLTTAQISVTVGGHAETASVPTWNQDTSGNAGSATKLKNARTLWGQSFDGTANVSGNLESVGSITATGLVHTDGNVECTGLTASADIRCVNLTATGKRIYFGSTDNYIEVDASGYFHFSKGLYSDGFVTALGAGSGGGSGSGSGYGLMTSWGQAYDEDNDALAAKLGVSLRNSMIANATNIGELMGRMTNIESARDYICTALYDLDGRVQGREVLNSIGELAASHITTDTFGAQYALLEGLDVEGQVSASGGFVGNLTGNVSGNAATATTAASAQSAPWSGVTGTPTTLAGYGITDAYAKTDVYTKADVYTRTEIDNKLSAKANSAVQIIAGTGLSGGGTLEANRTLSLAACGTAGTYTKVTTDAYGRVTSGSLPTTLAGYGITDAYTKTAADAITSQLCGALYDLDGRAQGREVLNSIGELTATHICTDTFGCQYGLIEGLEVSGTSALTGAVTLGSTLSVAGAATLSSTLYVGSTATLVGAATLNSTLSVDGGTTVGGSLYVGLNSILHGTVRIDGATQMLSTLYVGSTATLAGAATLNSTLSVDGAATFGSAIAAVGNITSEGAITALTAASSSDARLKRNIRYEGLTAEQIAEVRPARFEFSRMPGCGKVGAIAQDLAALLPEAVGEDGRGYMTVEYGNAAMYIALSLAQEVARLKKEINELKNR